MIEPLKKAFFKRDNDITSDAYRLVRLEGIVELNISRVKFFHVGDVVFLSEARRLLEEYDPNFIQFILEE